MLAAESSSLRVSGFAKSYENIAWPHWISSQVAFAYGSSSSLFGLQR